MNENQPTLFVSYDIGNHYVKVMVTRENAKSKTIVIDSGINFSRDGFELDASDKDTFTCKHGSKIWRNRSWYSTSKGFHPYDLMDSEFCFGDTPKGFLSFPLLTLAIWDELKADDVLCVNGTVQNIHTNRPQIIQELTGIHTVTKGSEVKRFEILEPQIMTEGIGVLMEQSPKKDDVSMLLDLGGDTVIISFFDGLKLKGDIYPVPGIGTNLLVKWCIGRSEISNILGRQPYSDAEALQIIRGEQIKNVKGEDADFSQALEALAINWIAEIKKEVMNKLAYEIRKCNKLYATGGGAMIAGVDKVLAGHNIQVVKDGQLANVRGLHKRLLAQNNIVVKTTNKKPKPSKETPTKKVKDSDENATTSQLKTDDTVATSQSIEVQNNG
jgi:hypothetical protein